MSLKKSRFTVYFLNSLLWTAFFIPLIINKMRKKNSAKPRNILIMELWGIGDLVMMSSILQPIRENYPQAKITVLSKGVGKTLFKDNPNIDGFVNFDFPWTRFKNKYALWKWNWPGLFKTIGRLKKEKIDLILDARGDVRNNILSFLIGARIRLGYGWTGAGMLLTDDLGNTNRDLHRVDAWLNLLKYLGLSVDNCKPYLHVSSDEEKFAEDFLKENAINGQDLLIGVHPGARIKTRCWPLDRFARVSEYARDVCKSKVIVFLEPEGYGDDIPIDGEKLKVKLNLRKLIGLIKKLDLLICNDGGVMHIATAVNTAVVAIFGPTNPVWFGPYGANSAVIIDNNIPCRPCFDYCRFKKPACLEEIAVNQVNKKIHDVLNGLNKLK